VNIAKREPQAKKSLVQLIAIQRLRFLSRLQKVIEEPFAVGKRPFERP
jgi:hypothetical protein